MNKFLQLLPCLCIALIVAGVGCFTVFNDHEVVATVVDKAVKVDVAPKEGGGASSYYLIFTDKGVFKNTDEPFRWKFDSSNFYAKIRVGETYRFTLIGWRIPFFSVYENIIKAESVRSENDGNKCFN